MSGHCQGLCSDSPGDVGSPLAGYVRTAPTMCLVASWGYVRTASAMCRVTSRGYVRTASTMCLVTSWGYVRTVSAMSGRLGQRQLSVSSPSALPGPSAAIHGCSPDSVGRHRSGSLLGKSSKRLSVAISLALDREVIAEECAENKVLFRGESRNGVLYQNPNRLQTLGFSEK